MKSIKNLGTYPTSLPLLADDILEFHAARLLLLFKICGESGQLRGLTKMAKLDFFIRYPQFFQTVAKILGKDVTFYREELAVESKMVRYHYGPWDQRYYHVLAYLEAKRLISVKKDGTAIILGLTPLGDEVAAKFEQDNSFAQLVEQIYRVNDVMGHKKGNELKSLIYQVFDQEIAKLTMGEEILQ